MQVPPLRHVVPLTGLVFILAAASFIAGRQFGGSDTAEADRPLDVPPGPEVVANPDQTPVTSVPFWYVPYQNAEDKLPRYEQVLNGIRIGPNVRHTGLCSEPAQYATREQITGSTVEIKPEYLPPGTEVGTSSFMACAGHPAGTFIAYRVPPNEEDLAMINSGALDWFDAKHGGSFEILRYELAEPGYASDFPSGRFEASTVNGHPAVFGPPMFSRGFGRFEIIVWQDELNIITIVRGDSFTLDEANKIAIGATK